MGSLDEITGFVKDPLDIFGGQAAGRGIESQERVSERSLGELRRQFDIGQERLEPFFQEAVPAFQLQAALSGARGPEAQGLAFQQFQESPGVQFLREQGLRNIDTSAAATGGLGGGERLRELTRFSQGLALQDFGDQFNRLGIVSGQGQTAATQQAGLGERFAGQAAGVFGQQGAATQQILQGQQQQQQQAIGTGLGAVASFFSDIRLKENIHWLCDCDAGLGWYTWDWTEEAKGIVGDQMTEGVIAQEVLQKFPEAVTVIDGFYAVDYGRLH